MNFIICNISIGKPQAMYPIKKFIPLLLKRMSAELDVRETFYKLHENTQDMFFVSLLSDDVERAFHTLVFGYHTLR